MSLVKFYSVTDSGVSKLENCPEVAASAIGFDYQDVTSELGPKCFKRVTTTLDSNTVVVISYVRTFREEIEKKMTSHLMHLASSGVKIFLIVTTNDAGKEGDKKTFINKLGLPYFADDKKKHLEDVACATAQIVRIKNPRNEKEVKEFARSFIRPCVNTPNNFEFWDKLDPGPKNKKGVEKWLEAFWNEFNGEQNAPVVLP